MNIINQRKRMDIVEPIMSKLFSTYRLTSDRQILIAGIFKWLKENQYDPMTADEVKTSIKMGFPEILS